ncbi:hypothetical protein P421_03425 [Heyndrickxia coagulans P38]|nr:hypothetical protein P421_03425 [Heyndrickxia coagulans P38]KYC59166.1 hypothetical protein B4100_3667 [Heyndrickxia coagulans]
MASDGSGLFIKKFVCQKFNFRLFLPGEFSFLQGENPIFLPDFCKKETNERSRFCLANKEKTGIV